MDQSMQGHMIADQAMKVSPTLIMVNQLLALSSMELQHLVRSELEQNPALESVEGTTCASCGAGTTGLYCPVCMQAVHPTPGQDPNSQSNGDRSANEADDGYDIEDYRPRTATTTTTEYEDYDPLTLIAFEASMTEQLLADVKVSLPLEDHPIAEYLIGSLDEQGFLRCSVQSAARHFGVEPAHVEKVLGVVQRTGPTGVAARDLRECLLMQLDEIRERGDVEIAPYVEEIISDYLSALGEHKYTIIAQALNTSYESVVAVRDFIKKYMEPRPLQEPPQARSWRSPTPTRFSLPDVIIREKDKELEVEVVESYRFSLRINSLYQTLASNAARHNGHNGISDEEREHIRRYVNRSKLFISNINQRRETMLRITTCLVGLQEEFIRFGVRYLRPLTRAQVAQYLGVHESTVSRATADKYVMLPNKHVIPFSDFFSASLSAKDVIKELITKEGAPMTDKEIVNHLREHGIRVARRTVTKYRNQLGILPSAFR